MDFITFIKEFSIPNQKAEENSGKHKVRWGR
jgi:hypothetical protein